MRLTVEYINPLAGDLRDQLRFAGIVDDAPYAGQAADFMRRNLRVTAGRRGFTRGVRPIENPESACGWSLSPRW